MAAYDASSTGAVLKQVFDKRTVKETIYPTNPLLGMVKKTSAGGVSFEHVIQYGVAGGRSRTITTALANKKPAKYARFSVPYVKDYNAISLDRMFMFQSDGDDEAFLNARVTEVKKVLTHLSRSLGMGMYRGYGGSCGRIATSSGISGSTITLQDTEEVCNFEVGDVLVVGSANGNTSTDTLRTGSLTITHVNRDTGVITCSAAILTGIPSAINGDYIFKDGDFQLSLHGLEAWNPSTAPTAGVTFCGVDRAIDATRLAGHIVSAVGDPITEAIAKGCARLGREQRNPDTVMMSHRRMRDLILELGSKVIYSQRDADGAKVGFKGVKFLSPAGEVECFADQNCPDSNIRIMKKSEVEILYVGNDVPELQDQDGSLLCRESSADAYEVRGSYYCNLKVHDPSELCNVVVA